MKQKISKQNNQFLVALLAVVVFGVLIVLFQQGFFAPRPPVEAARPLSGGLPITCYNQSAENNINYNSYTVTLDTNNNGAPDSFGFDASNNGVVDFTLFTGDFNQSDVSYSTLEDLNNMEVTISDVIIHSLGVYDQRINDLLDKLSLVSPGSFEEVTLNSNLDALLAAEEKVITSFNLLFALSDQVSPLPCALLGLESAGLF